MKVKYFCILLIIIPFFVSCKQKLEKEDFKTVCDYVSYDLVTGYIFDESYHHLVYGTHHEKLISETKVALGEKPSLAAVRLSSKTGYDLINKYIPQMTNSCIDFLKRAQNICNIPDEKAPANINRLTKIYQQSLGTTIVSTVEEKKLAKVDITQFSVQQLEDSLVKNRSRIKDCGVK